MLSRINCPCCTRTFGGKTAQNHLNAHCKKAHLDHYRIHIRPLKDPKTIRHETYIRKKLKSPERLKDQRLMAKFRKNAREELLEDIRTRKSPTPPPKSPPPIEAANPYHLLEYEFGKFVGNTKVEILEHDVNKSLDLISRELSHPLPHNLRKARVRIHDTPRHIRKYGVDMDAD
jgi:hypothetical protein